MSMARRKKRSFTDVYGVNGVFTPFDALVCLCAKLRNIPFPPFPPFFPYTAVLLKLD